MLTTKPIDLQAFLRGPGDPASGASVVFTGIVRDHHEGRKVRHLVYESYAAMAEKRIRAIADRAVTTHGARSARVLHRTGRLEIGDVAVVVEVRSAHRAEAFGACRQIIDEIKRDVPIWKKEFYADGDAEWVSCEHGGTRVE